MDSEYQPPGMRDVSEKKVTKRTATAQATLRAQPETIRTIVEGRLPKGDPLPVAKVAAIQAAKNTSQIIPYCHPLPVEHLVSISRSGAISSVSPLKWLPITRPAWRWRR